MLALNPDANGQTITSPYHIALGGGIAYTSGTPAQFYNPANLMIRTQRRNFQVTLGLGGVYYSNGLEIGRFNRFSEQVHPYFMPDNLPQSATVTESGLQQMFGDNNRYHQTLSYDMIPVGVSWMREFSARSVAFRSRGFSSYEMNRNWYVSNVAPGDEDEPFTRYFNEKYHVFHELSIGFAREVTMFNRWQSGLNTLLIGLAPKVVIGGMHSVVNFHSEYLPNDNQWHNTKQLEARSSGDMSRFITDLVLSGQVNQAFQNNLNRNSNLDINGYGVGLDAGLTYIIPLGNDISLSPYVHEPLNRSLRFSIAITDFGMVRFEKHPGQWNSRAVLRSYDDLPQSTNRYDGQPGELFRYLHTDPGEQSVFENLVEIDDTPYTVQLPTELHLGTAFQYDWFVSLLDLNYRFNPSDYKKDGWLASLGSEVRLYRYFPIQGSIQLEPGGNISFGLGAGLDFGFLHVSAAARMFHNNSNEAQKAWQTDTVSALGLQIRF